MLTVALAGRGRGGRCFFLFFCAARRASFSARHWGHSAHWASSLEPPARGARGAGGRVVEIGQRSAGARGEIAQTLSMRSTKPLGSSGSASRTSRVPVIRLAWTERFDSGEARARCSARSKCSFDTALPPRGVTARYGRAKENAVGARARACLVVHARSMSPWPGVCNSPRRP